MSPVRTYEQQLAVTFASPADAAGAQLNPLPVLDGKTWAFSARWDDNSPLSMPVQAVMVKYGLKGTFYLNASVPGFGLKAVRTLMTGGCSIGGHTQTHAYLPGLLPNQMFYEVLANRVQREPEAQTPINCFAFPDGAYESKFDPQIEKTISEVFVRSGFINTPYLEFAKHNPNLPPAEISTGHQVTPGDHVVNAAAFDKQVEHVLKTREISINDSYLIHMGVHARQTGPELVKLEGVFKKYSGNSDWWYCTMTQYAAYERQFRNTKIEKVSTVGAVCHYRITRPIPSELGDDVPLTVAVEHGAVKSVEPTGFVCDQNAQADRVLLDLHHGPDEATPTKIDSIDNVTNAAEVPVSTAAAAASKTTPTPAFPDLHSWLYCDEAGKQLKLTIENEGTSPVRDVNVTLRLPPLYLDGLRHLPSVSIAPGERHEFISTLGAEESAHLFREGQAYFVAETDFRHDDQSGRIFATTRLPVVTPDTPCVRDASWMLGPMSPAEVKPDDVAALSKPDAKLVDQGAGPEHHWFASAADDRAASNPDCAMLFWKNRAWHTAAGQMDSKAQCFLVALDFTLSEAAKLKITSEGVPAGAWLNGHTLSADKEIDGAVAGKNRVILMLSFPQGRLTFSPFPSFLQLQPSAGTLRYTLVPPQL